MPAKKKKIAVIGLGYVGLPLAVALARHFSVLGFDIKQERIEELRKGFDRTDEVQPETLEKSSLKYSARPEDLDEYDIFIITTPTPINEKNQPNLEMVLGACKTIGPHLRKGNIVILESTVYPGVTENKCGPLLEKVSGLKAGHDFFLGYSPERINPGDKTHTISKITKVIAGQTPEVTDILEKIYGAITEGNVFRAKNIKTAEASKVIENAQRDLNIAFINEAAIIFNRAGLSIYDVLDAANTKWNFLDFRPGLVGGHCIGVDPYYLAHYAQEVNTGADLILTARRINNAMAPFVAEELAKILPENARVLVLGLTFKENVPDLRNSLSVPVIETLREKGFQVDIYDPVACPDEARQEYNLDLLEKLPGDNRYDMILGLVAHRSFTRFGEKTFERNLKKNGIIADIKGLWRSRTFPGKYKRWVL